MESEGLDANDDHHFQGKLFVTCSHYGLQFVASLIIGIILVDPSGLNIVSKISFLHLLELLKLFFALFSNGGGQILFSEFVDWALEKNLDLEDDIDEEEE